MDVSIIIVNYNTKELTRNCLTSIYEKTKDVNFEVFVSDNNSKDGSISMIKKEFPSVILLENNANIGFGAANNRALKQAKGKYVFYLNSDTVLLNNAVKLFFDYFENAKDKENIGALGCNLVNGKGLTVDSYSLSFPSRKKEIYNNFLEMAGTYLRSFFLLFHCVAPVAFIKATPQCPQKKQKIAWIIGADLFIKNDDLAYFDEKYFLYYEETDLEYRLYKNNKKRIIIDSPKIVHLEDGSSNNSQKLKLNIRSPFSLYHLKRSQIIYLRKNCPSKIAIILVKLLTIITWLNPYLIKKTFRYIPKLLKV
jgi:GT2 family glycosyltransferase